MKGLKRIAELSKIQIVPLYYSFEKDTVYDKPGDGRFYVTDLIRDNEPQDIVDAVNRWKTL